MSISVLFAIFLAAVPPGIDPEVYNWFISVDADHSGKITAKELQQALIYGNWKHSNDKSAHLMICEYCFCNHVTLKKLINK